MNIQHVHIVRLAIPFSAGQRKLAEVQDSDKYNGASPNIKKMETLLVRVETDNGLVGWGEAFGHGSNCVTFTALEQLVTPLFLGKSLNNYEQALYEAKRALHSFGTSGPMLYALSAIDTAVWDIKAKAANQPLYQYLGGSNGHINLYASLVSFGNDPIAVAEQVTKTYQAGFTKIKLHETAPVAIAAAREALPSAAELMVDVNCPWNLDQAKAIVEEVKALQLGWLEEPIWPPENATDLAKLRGLGVPLSGGENASGPEGFEALFNAGAIDIAQPSVAKIGGITGMLDVLTRAKAHNVRVVPHCFYYGAGLLATAHIVAALTPNESAEIPYIELESHLHPITQFQPNFDLGDKPGLGFDPDPRLIEQYLIAEATLSNTKPIQQ